MMIVAAAATQKPSKATGASSMRLTSERSTASGKSARATTGSLVRRPSCDRRLASPRPVVDQTYQVALNLVFPDRTTQDAYQVHPQHLEFVEKYVKRLVQKVVVYDFE